MTKDLYLRKMKPVRKRLRENLTESEAYLWFKIRNSQLGYRFRRQVSIGYRVLDFYCQKLCLAIEIDGSIHSDEFVKANDDLRQEQIESNNVIFLRIISQEVLTDIENTLKKIKDFCKLLNLKS